MTSTATPLSSTRIVLVDDDQGHQELVHRNLRRSGIANDIVRLSNGASALDYVYRRGAFEGRDDQAPLLMVLDLKMPGVVDGIGVLRQIKADPDLRSIPIIVLTTTDDPRETRLCYELGCNVYITKPVQPENFVEAIRRLGLFLTVVSIPEGAA